MSHQVYPDVTIITQEITDWLSSLSLDIPKISLIAGSGMYSALPQSITIAKREYQSFSTMHTTTIQGHSPTLYVLLFDDIYVLCFGGRYHTYEGYTRNLLTLPVRIAAEIGCNAIICTNAAGGLNPSYSTGDLMIVDEIIDAIGLQSPFRSFTDDNIFVSSQDKIMDFHPQDMHEYNSRLTELKESIKHDLLQSKRTVHCGSYVAVSGPSYETRAEIRYYKMIADAIGMSTVHEIEMARRLGLLSVTLSMITNTLDESAIVSLSHSEVLETALESQTHFFQTIHSIIKTISFLLSVFIIFDAVRIY